MFVYLDPDVDVIVAVSFLCNITQQLTHHFSFLTSCVTITPKLRNYNLHSHELLAFRQTISSCASDWRRFKSRCCFSPENKTSHLCFVCIVLTWFYQISVGGSALLVSIQSDSEPRVTHYYVIHCFLSETGVPGDRRITGK